MVGLVPWPVTPPSYVHAARVIPPLVYCRATTEPAQRTHLVEAVTCPECQRLIVAEQPERAEFLPSPESPDDDRGDS
jgi:hypothetical protein